MIKDMSKVVHGSNLKSRKGLVLDETLKICKMIFEGVQGVDFSERTEDSQLKLDKFVRSSLDASSAHVIRSRREVVQHAAAFYYIVDRFVTKDEPMSERLIKDTHAILVRGASGSGAGFLSNKEFGGVYRTEDVFVGSLSLPKASTIPQAMRSMVMSLSTDLESAAKKARLDPFALAAKYCDRLVNIHPFRDGNGRMCRLILNAILIKYAGIVVNVGEHDQSRDEYMAIARESHEVDGHSGALGSLVLTEAANTLRRMRNKLKGKNNN